MELLSNAQLRRALSVSQGLAELQELEQYPAWSATMLRELIPCDITSYNAVDPSSQRASVAVDPAESVFDGGVEALARFIGQNPLVSHYARTGDGRALRISDFITLRQLHRTELYDHVYRHIGLEHQLAITIPSPRRSLGAPGEVIGLTLSRGRRDFSDSERLLLEQLRPSFASTLARLHELALLRAIVAGESEPGRWLILVTRDCAIAWTSPAAAEGLALSVGERLPPSLCRWLAAERARQERAGRPNEGRGHGHSAPAPPFPDTGPGPLLRPRLVRDAYPQLDALHLAPAERLPSAEALRSLTLTPRQAEVLAHALGGRTSAEIASALRLSPRTVEKHFEAIYARLGAANRGQAIATALLALAGERH